MAPTEQTPGPGALSQAKQIRAWFSQARPVELSRWNRQLDAADFGGNDAEHDHLHAEMVGVWLEHRDDPLPVEQRGSVVLAQSVAWIGDEYGRSWWQAHTLAATSAEHDQDIKDLVNHWRSHRDDAALPNHVADEVTALLRMREARVAEAVAWHQALDPRAHFEWLQCRAFADTVADAWGDDRRLVCRMLEQSPTTPTVATTDAHLEAIAVRASLPRSIELDHAPSSFAVSLRRGLSSLILGR